MKREAVAGRKRLIEKESAGSCVSTVVRYCLSAELLTSGQTHQRDSNAR